MTFQKKSRRERYKVRDDVAGVAGFDRLLRILAASATQRCAFGSRLALRAANSPQDCSLDARTFSGPNPAHKNHDRCRKATVVILAGVAGFEPTNAAVKVLCLTA